MDFKSIGLTFMLSSAALAPSASLAIGIGDGGIPVYCDNCAVATQNAAIVIGQDIQALAKILQETLNYQLKAQELNGAYRDAALENTKAAIDEDKKLGVNSLPTDACSVYASTRVRVQAEASGSQVRDDMLQYTSEHTRQSRSLPIGEPRKAYSVQRVIEELDEPSDDEKNQAGFDDRPLATKIASGDPIPEDQVNEIARLINLLLVPFPVPTPSEEEIQEIKANGTPQQLDQLAASLAMQRRQEVASYIIAKINADNVQNLDASEVAEFLESRPGVPSPFTDPNNKMISNNQLRAHMHNYRVQNPQWLIDISSAEDVITLERDQSMMMAEMMPTLWDIKTLLEQLLKQQAFESTREISQAGLQTR
jgi:hypothetical protein